MSLDRLYSGHDPRGNETAGRGRYKMRERVEDKDYGYGTRDNIMDRNTDK